MRRSLPTDFFENIDGIGRFRFARRKMADELQIQRLYAEYAGGVEPTVWLATLAEYLSTLRVLIVEAPESWDLDSMDPLDDDTYKKISRVFVALREREETFRAGAGNNGKGERQEDAEHGRSLVSPDVPPATE
ncbi:hypothetical protein IAJ44_004294 [Salmonella enterica]|nr:hypothetical protein [Salmonella enterica subsp. enterica serovar Mississippi]EGD6457233.1 hypothetical protein [Salmonella enterica]